MTDLFPGLALGEVGDRSRAEVAECEVVTAAVTKGMIVDLTHVALGLPKVSPAGIASVIAKGVVMAYCESATGVGTGAVGETVLVAWHCLTKVTVGIGNMTAGKMIAVTESTAGIANGTVRDGNTAGTVIGKAFQSGTSGDTGLVWLD